MMWNLITKPLKPEGVILPKSVKQLFEDAKEASDALAFAASPRTGGLVLASKFGGLEKDAELTRKELSAALERFHGITLDDLKGVD